LVGALVLKRGPKRISESKGRIAPKQKRSSSKGRFKKQSRNKEEGGWVRRNKLRRGKSLSQFWENLF